MHEAEVCVSFLMGGTVLVQSLSRVQLFVTPWTAAYHTSLSFTISQSLLRLKSIELVMSSNHLILYLPILLLHSIFSNTLALPIRWPKYWSFSLSISPFSEYSGLISFRMEWFDLPAVQSTPKSLLQHHSSKASILLHSFLYGPTLKSIHDYWKNHKFDYAIFVGKVMSLLFNILSRLFIAFLLRNKCLLISWLQSPHSEWFWSPRK